LFFALVCDGMVAIEIGVTGHGVSSALKLTLPARLAQPKHCGYLIHFEISRYRLDPIYDNSKIQNGNKVNRRISSIVNPSRNDNYLFCCCVGIR